MSHRRITGHHKKLPGRISVFLALILVLTGSCSFEEPSLSVKASDLGDRWPYKGFADGVLHCYPKHNDLSGPVDLQEITITLGGEEYGINGTALARFPDPHKFVPRNEFDTYDFKAMAGMDDLMDKGRALCPN